MTAITTQSPTNPLPLTQPAPPQSAAAFQKALNSKSDPLPTEISGNPSNRKKIDILGLSPGDFQVGFASPETGQSIGVHRDYPHEAPDGEYNTYSSSGSHLGHSRVDYKGPGPDGAPTNYTFNLKDQPAESFVPPKVPPHWGESVTVAPEDLSPQFVEMQPVDQPPPQAVKPSNEPPTGPVKEKSPPGGDEGVENEVDDSDSGGSSLGAVLGGIAGVGGVFAYLGAKTGLAGSISSAFTAWRAGQDGVGSLMQDLEQLPHGGPPQYGNLDPPPYDPPPSFEEVTENAWNNLQDSGADFTNTIDTSSPAVRDEFNRFMSEVHNAVSSGEKTPAWTTSNLP